MYNIENAKYRPSSLNMQINKNLTTKKIKIKIKTRKYEEEDHFQNY